MMAQPESLLVGRMMRALERAGCVVVKTHGSVYSRAGTPDLIGVAPGGHAFAIEVKMPGRRDGPAGNGASALQLRELRRWSDAGGRAGVCSAVDEAVAVALGGDAGGGSAGGAGDGRAGA